MSKQLEIIGNDAIVITENREVISKITGEPLKITNGKVVIGLFGIHKEVEVEWLYWYAVYRLPIPTEYRDRIFDLCFKDHGLLKHVVKDPKIVVFKKPVFVDSNKKYALIARFPRYAISKTGHIVKVNDILTHRRLRKLTKYDSSSNYYPTVSLFIKNDPFYVNRQIQIMKHRLVALTWHEDVCNIDFVDKPLVNHKDGNKRNCNISNLEFTSYSGNNSHAVASGLRLDNKFVVIRNIDTGEVRKFPSLTLAVGYIGRSRINTADTPLSQCRVWKGKLGRFEIYEQDNFKEWCYKDKPPESSKNINRSSTKIIVHHPDGDKRYSTIASFLKDELNISKRKPLEQAIQSFRKVHPDIKLTIVKEDDTNIIEARNVKTGIVLCSNNRHILAKKINVSESHIRKMLKLQDDCRVLNDWQIRMKTSLPWCKEYKTATNDKKTIVITNTETGEIKTANSLREAGKILSKDKKTIKKAIENNVKINNNTITYE